MKKSFAVVVILGLALAGYLVLNSFPYQGLAATDVSSMESCYTGTNPTIDAKVITP